MNAKLIFLLLCAPLFGMAQDTTVVAQYPDGNKMLLIVEQGDSTYQYFDDSGRYMEKEYKNNGFNGKCIGWYSNGNVKFEKTLENGQPVDTARFYTEKGNLVATIVYSDSIEELYSNSKFRLLVGKTHSSSVVHGGMELPGGGSNDTRSEGPMRFKDFVILETDPKTKEEKVVEEFTTDFDGNFCVVMNSGKYRILPKDFYERQLADPTLRLNQGSKGWWSAWSGNAVDLTANVYNHIISSSFVGVAP